ncbi:MAG TPA: hypothetical protein VIN35_14470 [Hydrogenophaga sp.]
MYLFRILLLLLAVQFTVWLVGAWQERQVATSETIGTLQGMTSGAGWRGGAVIAVRTTPTEDAIAETRFYPLAKPIAAKQGAPLILDTRANGALFICDAQRRACARTVSGMLR